VSAAQFVVATFVVLALIMAWFAERDFQRWFASFTQENDDATDDTTH